MTNEEAIKWLNVEASYIEADVGNGKEILEAYDIAIEALEQKPCEDCISRQAVIDLKTIAPIAPVMNGEAVHYEEVVFVRDLKELPSVTPQPKVGEWLEKEINSDKIEEWQSARCSICDKYHTTPYMYYFSHYEYCPHCGTKMEGRQRLDQGRSKRNSRDIHYTKRHP